MGDEIKSALSWALTLFISVIFFIIFIVVEYLILAFTFCRIHSFNIANTQAWSSKMIIYCQDTTNPGILTKILLPLFALFITYVLVKKIRTKSH